MTEDAEQGQSYEDRARGEPAPPEPPEPKPKPDDGPDPDAWMVTFSDLLTLLMTFFVLIFASQDPVKEKLFEAFGQSTGVFGMFRTSFFESVAAVPRQDISQDRVEVFLQETGSVNIDVKQEERGLVITIPANALFRPGSAALTRAAVQRVAKLAELLKFTRHNIRVEGHTDTLEPPGGAVGSAWELSVERAHAVLLRLVLGQIDERRLSLVGYGPSRPRFSNVSRRGRQRNRRVELVILNRGENP
jgi:chemotaxis protein MotB